jgi:hypothetical protein
MGPATSFLANEVSTVKSTQSSVGSKLRSFHLISLFIYFCLRYERGIFLIER